MQFFLQFAKNSANCRKNCKSLLYIFPHFSQKIEKITNYKFNKSKSMS